MQAQPRHYRSIFLSPDWAHQKYFGWRVVFDEPGLRVLTKKRLVFDRFLVLLNTEGASRLCPFLDGLKTRTLVSDVIIHDFDDCLAASRALAARPFRPAEKQERLLNIATFVIDLSQPEEAILSAMTSDYRRKIRKAEGLGIEIEAHRDPAPALRDGFLSAFESFAKERGLKPADPNAVTAMYRAKDAILFVARNNDTITNYLHIYIAGDTGSFMHGVNLSKVNDGTGQFLHWEAMRSMKEQGLSWYDFGGVAKLDPSDGIYNFKEKFGGQLVRLGSEWRYQGAILKSVAKTADTLKSSLRARS